MELVERVQELRKDIELGLKTDVIEISVELIKTETELKQLIKQLVSQRSKLYFAFMEEYNALMGESEHQILKEEVVVLLAKYCG